MAYNQEMAEAQKIRDRQMREIRSFICTNKNRIRRIKFAKNIIQDLENYGPAGILHMAVLSNIIRKNIKIWNPNGSLNRIIGKEKVDDTVEVEYHATNLEHIGHWTLRSGKDPDNINIDLNSCLFSVIGSQTGQNPSDLRKWTVLKLKSDLQKFANLMDKMIRSKGNDGIALMIGGARYTGTSHYDAERILDNSQGQRAHGMHGVGHPRGHASYPLQTRYAIDSVEAYSINSEKTGFLSRYDQNICAHWILITHTAQIAMNQLNRETIKAVIHLPAYQLGMQLPKAIPTSGYLSD
ncbi:uncharacterized protein [Linepithema humile]|uniref:uncharacterized protein n=1 Tax=Linepithema humile TaxID=83485 RepID=UPI00351DC3CB